MKALQLGESLARNFNGKSPSLSKEANRAVLKIYELTESRRMSAGGPWTYEGGVKLTSEEQDKFRRISIRKD